MHLRFTCELIVIKYLIPLVKSVAYRFTIINMVQSSTLEITDNDQGYCTAQNFDRGNIDKFDEILVIR